MIFKLRASNEIFTPIFTINTTNIWFLHFPFSEKSHPLKIKTLKSKQKNIHGKKKFTGAFNFKSPIKELLFTNLKSQY